MSGPHSTTRAVRKRRTGGAGGESNKPFMHRTSVLLGILTMALGLVTGLVNLWPESPRSAGGIEQAAAVSQPSPKSSESAISTTSTTAPIAGIDLAGEWEGPVDQVSFGPYSIKLTLRNSEGKLEGTVAFPELSCTGSVEQISRSGTTLVLREEITKGTKCILNGHWTFTVKDANTMEGEYRASVGFVTQTTATVTR